MTENTKATGSTYKRKELEIDLMQYGRKLWAARKLLLKAAGIAVLVGLVFAFTTPRKYTVSVTLAFLSLVSLSRVCLYDRGRSYQYYSCTSKYWKSNIGIFHERWFDTRHCI